MTKPFSRRIFAQASMALPIMFFGTGTSSAARQVTSSGPLSAAIGSTRNAFDADYGTSRQESGFTVYDFRHNQQAAYWIRFDMSGHADYIEIDFTALPGGGLTYSEEELGTSRFVPADAVNYGAIGRGGAHQLSGTSFNTTQYSSEQLSAVTGRSGNLLVMDEFQVMSIGMDVHPPILRTFVSLEAFEIHPVLGRGTWPGIGSSLDDWGRAFQGVQGTQSGYLPGSPPVPGAWLLNTSGDVGDRVGELDIRFSAPISSAAAADLISGMLDPGREPMATYWLPPSPNGNIGLRVHVFNTYRYEYVTSIQYVHNGEENGTVSRIMIVASWAYPFT